MARLPAKLPAWALPSAAGAKGSNTSRVTKWRWLKWPALTALVFGMLLVWHRQSKVDRPVYPPSSVEYQQDQNDDVPEKALILASFLEQDIAWLSDAPKDWRVYRYIADYYADPDFDAAPHGLPVPTEKGREAHAYLTYIVDHYDQLPRFMLFMHGHNRSWHQPEYAPDKMRALNLTAVAREGYISLKCIGDKLCLPEMRLDLSKGPDGISETKDLVKLLPAFWIYAFQGQPEGEAPLPEVLANQGQAQFAVTAETIRRRPLEFWKRLREPMLDGLDRFTEQLKQITADRWNVTGDEAAVEQWQSVKVNSKGIGLLFEKSWHAIFGRDAFCCPEADLCWKTHFGDAISCEEISPPPEKKFVVHHDCTVNQDALATVERENKQLLDDTRDNSG